MRKPATKICVTLAGVLLVMALFTLTACGQKTETAAPKLTRLTPEPAATQPALQARKEVQPPNVKVKRDKEGVYTWEITGRDVGAIIEADRSLRKKLASPSGGEKP